MTVTWMLWMLVMVSLALTTPRAITRYLARLPYAPECPHCRAVTSQRTVHGVIDRLCSVVTATPVRTCARCGWAGRMRWRPAWERARQH
jgi:hypothetical protein